MRTKREKTRVTTILKDALTKSMDENDDNLNAYNNAVKACVKAGGWTFNELKSLPVCDTLFGGGAVKTYKI